MAVSTKTSIFLCGLILQNILVSDAKPFGCGYGSFGYGGCGYPVPAPGCAYPVPAPACGYPVPAPTPPISFAPVPQPVPIRVPAPRPQSVTIPNIILALLPPTNKAPPPVKPCFPPAPRPIVLPLPQPYPVPVPDCGCAPPPCGC